MPATSESPSPSPEDTNALTEAAVRGFETPCRCYVRGRDLILCPAHDWLTNDPTQRGLCRQWQRLLYYRALVRQGLYTDSLSPAPAPPTLDPTRLPW